MSPTRREATCLSSLLGSHSNEPPAASHGPCIRGGLALELANPYPNPNPNPNPNPKPKPSPNPNPSLHRRVPDVAEHGQPRAEPIPVALARRGRARQPQPAQRHEVGAAQGDRDVAQVLRPHGVAQLAARLLLLSPLQAVGARVSSLEPLAQLQHALQRMEHMHVCMLHALQRRRDACVRACVCVCVYVAVAAGGPGGVAACGGAVPRERGPLARGLLGMQGALWLDGGGRT